MADRCWYDENETKFILVKYAWLVYSQEVGKGISASFYHKRNSGRPSLVDCWYYLMLRIELILLVEENSFSALRNKTILLHFIATHKPKKFNFPITAYVKQGNV